MSIVITNICCITPENYLCDPILKRSTLEWRLDLDISDDMNYLSWISVFSFISLDPLKAVSALI